MELSTLLSVGGVTGVVGMLTGVVGAVLGYRADRKVESFRRGDRRLELRRLRNGAEVAAGSLLALMAKSLESRRSVLHKRGLLKSSILEDFETGYGIDLAAATQLARSIPNPTESFDSLSPHELDESIVEIDLNTSRIADLAKRYREHLEEDAKWSSSQDI